MTRLLTLAGFLSPWMLSASSLLYAHRWGSLAGTHDQLCEKTGVDAKSVYHFYYTGSACIVICKGRKKEMKREWKGAGRGGGDKSSVLEVLDMSVCTMRPPDGNQWDTWARDRPSLEAHTHTLSHSLTDTHKHTVALLPPGRTPWAPRLHINANRVGCVRNLLAPVH